MPLSLSPLYVSLSPRKKGETQETIKMVSEKEKNNNRKRMKINSYVNDYVKLFDAHFHNTSQCIHRDISCSRSLPFYRLR